MMSAPPAKTSRKLRVEWIPKSTCQIRLDGDLRVTATGKIRDRDVIRATVTVHRGSSVVYPDKVNLTSGQGRRRFLKDLHANSNVVIEEDILIALEQGLRRGPVTNAAQSDGRGDTSGKVPPTVAALEAEVKSYLLLEDPDVLPVMLATFAAHQLGGEPVWLLLVGPPSGAKTELIRMTGSTKGVYPLSKLTARTFASGLKTEGDDPSLLERLTNETLTLKDFTTVLELPRDERQEILAQLREIYDGKLDVVWGAGKELHWEGKLGFVAGVTAVIDKHHAVMALLGPRFMFLRLRQPDRRDVARRVVKNRKDKKSTAWRTQLASDVAAFLASLPRTEPDIPNDVVERITVLADVVSRARSAVERDGYKRELDYAPEPEMPPRLVEQYLSVAQGLALVNGRSAVNDSDVTRVVRVGLDCIPAVRRMVLSALVSAPADSTLTTTVLAQHAQYSTTTIRRALEDLQCLELVQCTKGGEGRPDSWNLRDSWHPELEPLFAAPVAATTTVGTQSPPVTADTGPSSSCSEDAAAITQPPVPAVTDAETPPPAHASTGSESPLPSTRICPDTTSELTLSDAEHTGTTAAGGVASVPFMITRAMVRQLEELGYPQCWIDTLRPEQAHDIINGRQRFSFAFVSPALAFLDST
jgi:hypothetical protein